MKTNLTTEQSAELIKRGISVERASAVDDIRAIIDGVPTFSPGTNPIFTLADLLSLIPKKIELDEKFYLDMTFSTRSKWEICYINTANSRYLNVEDSTELIDALNLMLIWCIDNHVKLD